MTKRDPHTRPAHAATLTSDAAALSGAARVVPVVALAPDGTISVGVGGAAVPARLAVPASRERIETAVLLQQHAVVIFEAGDEARPIIIGLIETLAPTPDRHEPRGDASTSSREVAADQSDSAAAPMIEADVDGKRIRIVAQDELVLQCGSASVTLRRNGRVVVRGTYVETHSEGTNRIKGGQVLLN